MSPKRYVRTWLFLPFAFYLSGCQVARPALGQIPDGKGNLAPGTSAEAPDTPPAATGEQIEPGITAPPARAATVYSGGEG